MEESAHEINSGHEILGTHHQFGCSFTVCLQVSGAAFYLGTKVH
jgi:hypothetical protein